MKKYENVLISNIIILYWYSDYCQIHMIELPKDYQIDFFKILFKQI